MSVKRALGLFNSRGPSRVAAEAAARQREVRLLLLSRLSESTKAVQHEFHDSDQLIPSCELTDELCCVLEAIFIHGLRDTFLDKVSNVISNMRPPEPNCWAALMVLSHTDIIDQISGLTQLHTDIGKTRAWLRTSLNDGLLTSYITMMLDDRRLLGSHYDKLALLRNRDQMDIVLRYLLGLDALRFALATNSSLLNKWDEAALELAGLWFRPRSVGGGSLYQGEDAAAAIGAHTPRPQPPAELALPLPEPQMPTLILNALEPDMAFDVIMRTTSVDRLPQPAAGGGPVVPAAPVTAGGGAGTNSEASSLAGELAAITTPPASYMSVLESYRESSPRARSLMQTPDVQFVYGKSVDSSTASSTGASTELETSGESEQLPQPAAAEQQQPAAAEQQQPEDAPDDPPPKPVDPRYYWLTEIPPESGLDRQSYTCGSCQRFVGMLYGEPRICSLDGRLFCGDCHTGRDLVPMSARIVHNWDFSPYSVARCSREFMEQVDGEPVINLAEQNLSLYNISADVDRVRLLRTRLVFLNAYMLTCRSTASAELHRRLAGRLHLCEHVHLYAPVDLRDTHNGSLTATLQSVVEFGVAHVKACSLCSQKGFVCEFCKDRRIIYPFELETTRQCRKCYGLYHSRCWRRPAACPRCERYRRRAEMERLLEVPDLGGDDRGSPTRGRQSRTKQLPAAYTAYTAQQTDSSASV